MQYFDEISKMKEWSLFISKAISISIDININIPFTITVILVYASTSKAEEAEVEQFYEDVQDLLELIPQKDVLFIIGDWNAKVGSQKTPGITGNLALKYRMKQGKG